MDRILLLDENKGVYIPQQFARMYYKDVTGIDLSILQKLDIDHVDYWEAWEDVLQHAMITIDGHQYTLEQDGDLWAVPI
jgi:hypothetical protein